MDRDELNELGGEFLDDLADAFDDYDFIDVSREGITPDGDGAIYEVCIEWDSDDQEDADVSDEEIEDVIDGVCDSWEDYATTYDWDGSTCILVALHVDDYDEEDDDDDDDDDEY